MGNGNSQSEDSKEAQRFYQSHALINKSEDPRLGKIEVYEEKKVFNRYDGEKEPTRVILKTFEFGNKQEYNDFKSKTNKRLTIEAPCLSRILDIHDNTKTTPCNDFLRMNMVCETIAHDLEAEIRVKSNLPESSENKVEAA